MEAIMKRRLTLGALVGASLAVLGLLVGGGCSRSGRRPITLAGSTAFQPFAEKVAERYMASHPDVQVLVQGGGSAVGIQSALSGAAEIGMADLLQLPDEAKSLTATVVARDGIAIVVNPQNPITGLSAEQARAVFSGRAPSWKAVGGADTPIRVVSREEGSGTRRSFDKLVLGGEKLAPGALFQNSNGTVREAVASDAAAAGYVSMGLVNERVKALRYDGVEPNNANVIAGSYPLARPIFLLTRGEPAPNVKAFISYVLSAEAQSILAKEGLIPAK
jgi:phosphate transport system substrate-binding protein